MINVQHTMLEESDFEALGLNPEDFESYEYCDAFVNMDTGEFLGDFHENDGNWRDEYFNHIFKALGIKIKCVNISQLSDDEKEIWKKALEKTLNK